jgi:hypothetical protein
MLVHEKALSCDWNPALQPPCPLRETTCKHISKKTSKRTNHHLPKSLSFGKVKLSNPRWPPGTSATRCKPLIRQLTSSVGPVSKYDTPSISISPLSEIHRVYPPLAFSEMQTLLEKQNASHQSWECLLALRHNRLHPGGSQIPSRILGLGPTSWNKRLLSREPPEKTEGTLT